MVKALDDTDEFARECARKGLAEFSGKKIEEKDRKEDAVNKEWKKWFVAWQVEQKKNANKESENAKGNDDAK